MELLESVGPRPRQARYQAALRPDSEVPGDYNGLPNTTVAQVCRRPIARIFTDLAFRVCCARPVHKCDVFRFANRDRGLLDITLRTRLDPAGRCYTMDSPSVRLARGYRLSSNSHRVRVLNKDPKIELVGDEEEIHISLERAARVWSGGCGVIRCRSDLLPWNGRFERKRPVGAPHS